MLNDQQKAEYLDRLWEITKACYSGVELPTREDFNRLVKTGDVWVYWFTTPNQHLTSIKGYALAQRDYVGGTPLLISIAVLEEHRKHGAGGLLLTTMENEYRAMGIRAILLHCKVDNSAQVLYFKTGYRVTAVLRDYYRPEGNGLEMRKTL